MTVLPYIVIGGVVFYYLYENYHPDKTTTVPDIDIKQEIKKHKEHVPIIADETNWVKQKLPEPVPLELQNPNIRIKNTYDVLNGSPIIRNPLLGNTIINPNLNNISNSWNKGGPVFARMPNMRSNPNMHSPFTRSIHKNYIVAKF